MKNRLYVLLALLLPFLSAHASLNGFHQLANQEKTLITHFKDNSSKPFFSEHALVLFYSSTCSHCQRFAPILKNWALNHHATVIALSLDNKALPTFPNFKPATTQWIKAAFAGRSINYPALFVMNKKTHALYLVSTGEMSATTLNMRMTALISKIQTTEQRKRV